MATLAYVSDNAKKDFLKELELLASKDPRLNKATLSRILGHGSGYVSGLYSENNHLSKKTYKKWQDKIKKDLNQRIIDYESMDTQQLVDYCNQALENLDNRTKICNTLNITENTLLSTVHHANRTQRKRLLNIYDVLKGYNIYPSHKHQSTSRSYPKVIQEVRKEIKKLNEYGITLRGLCVVFKMTYGKLCRFLTAQQLTVRKQRETLTLLKQLRELYQTAQKMKPIISFDQLKSEYLLNDNQIEKLLTKMEKPNIDQYLKVGGRKEQKRCTEIALILEAQKNKQ